MTKINNRKDLKRLRRRLRNSMTPAEAGLWRYLKSSVLRGRKFRRQHSIENYIFDFYCPAEKLVIELDGEIHTDENVASRDKEKEYYLKSLGIRLLRFENKLVFHNLEYVLKSIEAAFVTTPSDPLSEAPPLKGGES